MPAPLQDIVDDLNAYEGDNPWQDIPSFAWEDLLSDRAERAYGAYGGSWTIAVVNSIDQGLQVLQCCTADFAGQHGEPWRVIMSWEEFQNIYGSELAELDEQEAEC